MLLQVFLDKPLSVNQAYHNWRGRFVLDDIGKQWKKDAAVLIKEAIEKSGWKMPEKDNQIVMELYFYWPDKRRRDTNNYHKLLCDAFTGFAYHDDNVVLVRDMGYKIDKQHPGVVVMMYPNISQERVT